MLLTNIRGPSMYANTAGHSSNSLLNKLCNIFFTITPKYRLQEPFDTKDEVFEKTEKTLT